MQEKFDVTSSIMHKRVIAGLQCCIYSHGPITKEWVGSAAKRIAQQIYGSCDFTKDMRELEKENQILKEKVRLYESSNTHRS